MQSFYFELNAMAQLSKLWVFLANNITDSLIPGSLIDGRPIALQLNWPNRSITRVKYLTQWCDTTHIDSEDDYTTGWCNVCLSHQQSYTGLHSPGRAHSTYLRHKKAFNWQKQGTNYNKTKNQHLKTLNKTISYHSKTLRVFFSYMSHMILIMPKKKSLTTDLLLTNPTALFFNDDWFHAFLTLVPNLSLW